VYGVDGRVRTDAEQDNREHLASVLVASEHIQVVDNLFDDIAILLAQWHQVQAM
jgi:hypothetical protein